jgi:hypothetical protein
VYTFAALQAWAREQGLEFQPHQTSRECCAALAERFPETTPEMDQLSLLYSHAVFGKRLPEPFESAPLQQLWRYLSDSTVAIS